MLIKGLPLAYNRDLQEDKEAMFDSFDTVAACLEVAAPLVAGAELNREAIAERLDRGHLDATTFMEWLDPAGCSAAHGPRHRRPAGAQGHAARRAAGGFDASGISGSASCAR